MTPPRLTGPRTANRSGRPITATTQAMRTAILMLTTEQDVMTVRGVFYALTTRGIVPKTEEGYRSVQRQVLEEEERRGLDAFARQYGGRG